jgi:hypothetical protein
MATNALHYLGYDGEDLREGSEAIDWVEHQFYTLPGTRIISAHMLLRAALEAIEKRRGAASD